MVREVLAGSDSGRHLSEDAWLALAHGNVVGDSDAVLAHLARCAECRDVLRAVRDLRQDAGDASLTAPGSGGRRDTRRVLGWAAAATLVLAFGGWLTWRAASPGAGDYTPSVETRPQTPADSPAIVATPEPRIDVPRPDWLRAEPPVLTLYSPGLLTVRSGNGQSFADAFGEATVPWRSGRYADAAARLAALTTAYPKVAEGYFYQGTAWLLAGAPAQSIAPLRRSVSLAPASLHADAAWYLGLALLDVGQSDEAARAFAEACNAGRPRACDAVRHVEGDRADTR